MTNPASVLSAQHVNWSAVPTERVGEGIERQMVWGDRVMVCRLRIAPRTVTPVHSHPHEQVTLVEQGPVEFTIDGQTRIVQTGDVLVFPSHIRHGATMLDQEVVLIDIFSPPREDFLPAPPARG
ncbi:MAG TPA: cupin domain-containing protein [Vicinamibacterales bacterium]|nr:cupin domain-containing protein [Vicinamibacterales bacterium]